MLIVPAISYMNKNTKRNSKPVGMLLLLGTVPEEVVDSGERETSQLVVRVQSSHATADDFCMYSTQKDLVEMFTHYLIVIYS